MKSAEPLRRCAHGMLGAWSFLAKPGFVLVVGFLLVACPEISVDPVSGPQGAEEMVIDVYGTNTNFSQSQTTAAFSLSGGPSGIVVHQPIYVVNKEHLRLTISIPAIEPIESHTLTVTTGSEEADTTFEVTAQPYLEDDPPLQGEQGDIDLVITVTGVGTHFEQSAPLPEVDISGVTVVSWNVVDFEHSEVILNISLDAPIGVVHNSLHVFSDHQVLTANFEITAAQRSIMIEPDFLEQGTTDTISITGVKTAFLAACNVSIAPPDGIDIVSVTPLTATTAEVIVAVSSNAAPIARTLTVTDSYGDLEADFRVASDSIFPEVSFHPVVVYPDQEITVEARGINTSFLWPYTVVSWEPEGDLTLEVIGASSPDLAQLTARASLGAAEKEYSVTLTTGAEEVVGSFWIVPEPSMTIDPFEEHQDKSVFVRVYGIHTHFDEIETELSFAQGSGLSGTNWHVTGPNSATFTLHVASDAPLGDFPNAITVSTPFWNETVRADFTVLFGHPAADLVPPEVEQGSQSYVVQANGRYTHWDSVGDDTTVTLEAECEPFMTIQDVAVSSQTELTFQVDVAVLAPFRSCDIYIVTDDGTVSEIVTVELIVSSGATQVQGTLPQTINGIVNGPQLYSIDLNQGEVLRARAYCDPVLYLDPTLAIYPPNGDYTSSPLAENEDEHAATEDALIVYQAPQTGTYYLVVQDRLGFEVGPFTLSLDYFAPPSAQETEPNNSLSQTDTFSDRLLKGDFAATDSTPDVYNVTSNVPGAWIAVQVIARSVSPYETSGADVILSLYDSSSPLPYATSDIGSESLDPVLYVLATDLAFIEVENDTAGLLDTTYWINLRPQVVINEVHHDETSIPAWTASFVELYGEPGMDLTDCHLLGKAFDTAPQQIFDIDLTGHQLLSSGYLVIAHDDLVPGTGPAYIDETLVISDPTSSYVSIGVVLECNGTALDAVCWRGSDLAECNATYAPDDSAHMTIGRGFHIDTDDNAADFLPQPEPSPWNRNLREVW